MISKPLLELGSYISYLRSVEFPVLRKTERELAALREDEERLSARQIAGVVLDDPLMALKLLIHLQRNRGRMQNHDITTIERAIMMLGVTPFFDRFGTLVTVEDQLAQHPKGLISVLRVIARAKRASSYARDWALLRHDIDVDEITVAALLHEVGEILSGCFAPDLLQHAHSLLRANPGMRSATAQRTALGVSLHELQLALVREYELPQLLVTLMEGSQSDNPRVRTVSLACDLARHAANGWDDPALPDDVRGGTELLRMSPAHFMDRIGVPPDAALRGHFPDLPDGMG